MRTSTIATLCSLIIAISAVGCATHRVPAAAGSLTDPRASWIIRAGNYGDEREMCRSDSDAPCVLQASSDQQPVNVVVSVYLFPAEAATTYRGAFMAGFVGVTGKGHESKVDYEVTPGRKPTGVTVAGRVTRQPGEYPFRIALFAEVPGRTDPYQFQQTFTVQVRSRNDA